MADETDTGSTPAKPATTRRRAPRKTVATTKAPAKIGTRKPATKAAAAEKSAAAAVPTAPKRAAAAPKPRAAGRPTPAPKRRSPPAAPKSKIEKATDKVGGKWGAAAIAGGIAAVGAAATAALLSLRSSTPKDETAKGAHTPDGQDASQSFEAGIADENTIPDKV